MRHMAVFLTLSALLAPGVALADDSLVDQGIEHYENGRFQEAIEVFDQAEWHGALSREAFIRMLIARAIVHYALEDQSAVDQHLFGLASLDPEHTFDRTVAPPIREAFERARVRVRRPLQLRVTTERHPGGVHIHAEAVSDVAGLVTSVEIFGRARGGEWVRGAADLEIPVIGDAIAEYHARILGPGGAVLVAEGSEEQPVDVGVTPPTAEPGTEALPVGDDTGLWVGVSVGLGVAIAAAVAVVLYFVLAPRDSTLAPMVEF